MKTRIRLMDAKGEVAQQFIVDGLYVPGAIGKPFMATIYVPNVASLVKTDELTSITYHEVTDVVTTDQLRRLAEPTIAEEG